MINIESIEELNRKIGQLLITIGAEEISVDEIQQEASESYQEILTDAIEFDEDPNDPFFSYMVEDNVAIFFFFKPTLMISIFQCDPHSLIPHIEKNYALLDVKMCKDYLKQQLNIEPNLDVKWSIALDWMNIPDDLK